MRLIDIRHWKRPNLDAAMHVAGLALGTILYAAAAWAFMNGPRFHTEAERRMAVEVEAENRDACGRLGMPPGGERYIACARELGRVRDQHADRVARNAAGSF